MPSTSRIRFNKSSLDDLLLPSRGKRATYYDTDVLKLQLRVTDRGVKSFCVFRRSKRGRPERITIGRFPSLSVEQARTKAKRYLADLGLRPQCQRLRLQDRQYRHRLRPAYPCRPAAEPDQFLVHPHQCELGTLYRHLAQAGRDQALDLYLRLFRSR